MEQRLAGQQASSVWPTEGEADGVRVAGGAAVQFGGCTDAIVGNLWRIVAGRGWPEEGRWWPRQLVLPVATSG